MRSVFAEEKDPSLCLMYEKVGSCEKGDLCNKSHRELPLSRAIVLHHIFPDPDIFINALPQSTIEIDQEMRMRLVNSFFLDVAQMLMQFGQLESMVIVGNKIDHLNGNVLALFHESDAAYTAREALNGQYYAGRRIEVTLAPVQRVSYAFCSEFLTSQCSMGDKCGFIHPIEPSTHVFDQLFPKTIKSVPTQLQRGNKKRIIDNPTDALYGRTKVVFY
ncbi:putative U2 snRNP auxiliary factor small subunit [Histomonas meleagridis]|uniref:putative U2 snRNP auxiliary factor small subunit n=1 Tax=Histomonas meleagridis TaxID=135588 RepID=UPI003559F38D|nr:putative U2 snRNP auxiliary factor small subunit [Histomonas meleagridis]KAH0798744.1 putative U2 snRNP auxiliary factor small subunit [Histomonas meleagridis]